MKYAGADALTLRMAHGLMLALAASLFLGNAPAFAQQPPGEALSARIVNDALPRKPSAGLILGNHTIRFEQATLSEIGADTLNVVTNHSVGDDAEHSGSTWLCYTLIQGNQRQRFWLMSDDLFGGGDKITGAHAVILKPSDEATPDCPDRSRHLGTVRFDNGIWLGASRQQLEAVLGTAPPAADGWWRYENVSQIVVNRRNRAEEYEVDSRFAIRLSKGRVVEIRASQISVW